MTRQIAAPSVARITLRARFSHFICLVLFLAILLPWTTANALDVEPDFPGFDDAKGNLLEQREGGTADANDPGSPAWPDVRISRYGYDTAGRLTSADGPRDDVDDTTRFDYFTHDADNCASTPGICTWRKGDLRTVTNALGHVTTTLAYDGAGRVLAQVDADGIHTDRAYDGNGRPTSVTVRARADGTPSSADAATRLVYDANGQVKERTDADGVKVTYEYDAAHRLTATADAVGNRHEMTLDNQGLAKVENFKNPFGTIERTIKRNFDNQGQVWLEEDSRGKGTRYTYDDDGRLTVTQFVLNKEERQYDLLPK
ncbi:hypothetical protein [Luteibacter yeojuensis]